MQSIQLTQPNSQNPAQLTKLNSPNWTQPIQLTQRNSAFSFFQTSNQDLIGMDVPCTDNNRQLKSKAYLYQRTVSMNKTSGKKWLTHITTPGHKSHKKHVWARSDEKELRFQLSVPVPVHVPVPASDITKVTHQARGDPGWANQYTDCWQ